MRRNSLYLLLLIFLGSNFSREEEFDYSISFKDKPSEISSKENPIARAVYEERLLKNPKSGKIPQNIRSKELIFSRSIPSKEFAARANNLRNALSTFELAGPSNVGGRTRGISLDVRNENIILAGGVSGGIWKSTDAGVQWKRTSDPTLRNSVSSLTQDKRPGKENAWYFGTGELVGNSARSLLAPFRGDGIYKSTDNGASWALLESTRDQATPDQFSSQFQYSWNIEVNRNNLVEDELLVAAFGGILKSLDGGQSWEVVIGEKLFDLSEETDLNEINASFYTSLRQTEQGYFFASLSSASSVSDKLAEAAGFYFSETGENWQVITPPNLSEYHERTVIGFSKDANQIYFLTQGTNDKVFLWRYEVTAIINGDIAGNWTNLTGNVPAFGGDYGDYDSQSGYNMLVEVHPDNKEVVFIGGTNLYRSTDGFTSSRNTKWIGGYSPENDASVYAGHHPDQHGLLFSPSNPSRVISANDGGVRLSNNVLADSVSWTSRNSGYLTSQFYTITQRQDEATSEILGGMQDNGSYFRDGLGVSPAWNRILGGDGAYCAITPGRDFIYVSFQFAQIYRLALNSNYSLTDFARVDPAGGGGEDGRDYLFINPYVLDLANPNRMYLIGEDVIWRNENVAQIPSGSQEATTVNWERIDGTTLRSDTAFYTSLEKCRSADIIYAGILGNRPSIMKVVNVSDSRRDTSTLITSEFFPNGGHIASISANPEDADHFLVIFSNYGVRSVFETIDGGQIFTDISSNLEETGDGSGTGPSIRWAEVVPLTSGITYYVGTSTGLYSMERNFESTDVWLKEGEEIIGDAVITMLDYRDIDGRLIVASHGNGTYQSYLRDYRPFEDQQSVSEELVLSQNFPNPFQDQTRIDYSIPRNGVVRIDIFDNTGHLIRHLLWGPQYKGESRLFWDGTNTSGVPLKAGVYYCVLTFEGKKTTKRIIYQP